MNVKGNEGSLDGLPLGRAGEKPGIEKKQQIFDSILIVFFLEHEQNNERPSKI
jgi:hypothetical protein